MMAEDDDVTSTDRAQISGKVAAILTKRELAINRGSADGVTVGMRFAILNSQGVGVKDPDTGKVLGSVELVKTVVKVVRVDGDHLCTARTFRTIAGTPGLADLLARSMPNVAGTPSRTETLKIDASSTLREELDPQDSFVKIGDPAVEATGDTYDDE